MFEFFQNYCYISHRFYKPKIWLLKDPIRGACLTIWTKSSTLTVNQLSKYVYFIKINWFRPYLGLCCCFLCYYSCLRVKGRYFPIRVFICICLQHGERKLCANGFSGQNQKRGKNKIFAVYLRSKFFLNFGHSFSPLNSV